MESNLILKGWNAVWIVQTVLLTSSLKWSRTKCSGLIANPTYSQLHKKEEKKNNKSPKTQFRAPITQSHHQKSLMKRSELFQKTLIAQTSYGWHCPNSDHSHESKHWSASVSTQLIIASQVAPAFWLPAPISKLKSMKPISMLCTANFNFG